MYCHETFYRVSKYFRHFELSKCKAEPKDDPSKATYTALRREMMRQKVTNALYEEGKSKKRPSGVANLETDRGQPKTARLGDSDVAASRDALAIMGEPLAAETPGTALCSLVDASARVHNVVNFPPPDFGSGNAGLSGDAFVSGGPHINGVLSRRPY